MSVLSDFAAERAVLAGICSYGNDAYLDVVDMLRPSSFMVDTNKVIWKCLEHVLQKYEDASIDAPTILSAAEEIGCQSIFKRREEIEHLAGILNMPIELSNVRRFAAKISKLEFARTLREELEKAKDDLLDITGSESIIEIINRAELDFSSFLKEGQDLTPKTLGSTIMEYLEHLADNPVGQIGISTGFPIYDASIGGGLRPATLNVIGARPKEGKTVLTDNMGYNISSQEIPVLNLDTEMTEEDHQHRAAAMLSNVSINEIECGSFGSNNAKREAVLNAGRKLEKVPYYHQSINGVDFEDQLTIMRRWVTKEVGLKADGTAKPCVIIYDYLKLMDTKGLSEGMREFQLLGFMMTSLHNFAHRYRIPFLVLMQLNRDGIEGEDTSAASGSDRIIWLCSNFTIFKGKSPEEIAEDGAQHGNKKLKVIIARHGAGMPFGEYVNCHMNGACAQIREGRARSEISALRSDIDDNEGFVDEDTDTPEHFG